MATIKSATFDSCELHFAQLRLYLVSSLFVFFSVATPYFLHLFSVSGRIFLPLYFFVLLAGYKFGWKTGVITASLAPIISYLLSGMPSGQILYLVVLKGVILGATAGFVSIRSGVISLKNLLYLIIFYQVLGLTVEFIMTGQASLFISDIRFGYPGLLMQLIGGYFGLKLIDKYI